MAMAEKEIGMLLIRSGALRATRLSDTGYEWPTRHLDACTGKLPCDRARGWLRCRSAKTWQRR